MIDKKIFDDLRKEIEDNDSVREKIIIDSRPILKYSKQVIYDLHKNDLKEAEKTLKEAEKAIASLKKIVLKKPELAYGMFNSALQEYTEAITYYHYVKTNKLISAKELSIDAENYLLGLCDLTGELSRRAVFAVVDERYAEVVKIREFVDIIYNEIMQFDLRNGELRKKADAVKWNMKKIEEILYDLKIREKL